MAISISAPSTVVEDTGDTPNLVTYTVTRTDLNESAYYQIFGYGDHQGPNAATYYVGHLDLTVESNNANAYYGEFQADGGRFGNVVFEQGSLTATFTIGLIANNITEYSENLIVNF